MSGNESKRERVLNVVHGKATSSYIPTAFFLHFDSEFHQGEAAVRKHEEFFRYTDMDFVKIQFELPFPQMEMTEPKDWAKLPRLDKAFFEPQLGVVAGLVNALKSEALVVCTLYSPFMIMGQIGGEKTLIHHMEQDADAVAKGLDIARDNLMVFVREALALGLDGFYHSTQGGETGRFATPSLFERYVKPNDLQVMREIASHSLFNILHICDYNLDVYGGYDNLTPFRDYPGHVISCDSSKGGSDVVALFDRPFMGGLDRRGVLATGREDLVRQAAREAILRGPEAMILGADCTVPPKTPWSNLKAAVEVAHKGR
jgi:uroporphyrinogen decarboxylase